ncbi:MAG: Sjogren's syndrome/scleroderma autoantigen 1 family protein [Candidatus Methanoperedens sp.]|nr:Sjogren's syndrome/scleroderma autoantigen 1 family protein [Candidatus Methanoperedens sp.]
MSKIDENLKMQKITNLLEKGGTMLAQSHDCGAPMFRFQGKVLCPVCDQVTEEEKKVAVEQESLKRRHQKESVSEAKSRIPDDSQIAAMTKKKIQMISEGLENETDLHRIKEKLECIELGIKILKLLG